MRSQRVVEMNDVVHYRARNRGAPVRKPPMMVEPPNIETAGVSTPTNPTV